MAACSPSSTPPTFPNGIAIEADGSVVWAESYTGMVRRLRLETGAIEDIARLPGEKPIADGMAVGADGRLYVTTVNGGGIDVIRPDGTLRPVHQGRASIPTNCVFSGRDLIMTDAGVLADTADASYGGQLWRLPIDAEGAAAPGSGASAERAPGSDDGVPVAHQVTWPPDGDPSEKAGASPRRRPRPRARRARDHQARLADPGQVGELGHLGGADATALHAAVTSLPMWPYLEVEVHRWRPPERSRRS